MSVIVIVNVQFEVLPAASATVQVTIVTPPWNVDPEGGEHMGAPRPGQLSLAGASG